MSPLAPPAMTPPVRRTVKFITTKSTNHSVATADVKSQTTLHLTHRKE